MTIRRKISLILSVVLILTGIVSAFIANNSIKTQQSIEIVVEQQIEMVENGTEAAYHVQRIKSNIREIVLEHLADLFEETEEEEGEEEEGGEEGEEGEEEENEVTYAIEVIKSSMTTVLKNVDDLENSIHSGLEAGLDWNDELIKVEISDKDVQKFYEGVQLFLKTHAQQEKIELTATDKETAKKHTFELRKIFEDKIEPISRIIQKEMKSLEEQEEEEMEERLQDVTASATTSTHASIALLIIIILAGLLIYYAIRKIITKPIDQLHEAVVEIGKGNFKIYIDVNRKDEIGLLAMTLEQMASELHQQRAALEQYSTELQDSSSRLTLATEAGNIGVWVWNASDNSLEWDKHMHALYGVAEGTKLTFNEPFAL